MANGKTSHAAIAGSSPSGLTNHSFFSFFAVFCKILQFYIAKNRENVLKRFFVHSTYYSPNAFPISFKLSVNFPQKWPKNGVEMAAK